MARNGPWIFASFNADLDLGDGPVPGTVDAEGFTLICVARRSDFEDESPRYRARTYPSGFWSSSDEGDAEASSHSSSNKDSSGLEPVDSSQDSSQPVRRPRYGSSGSSGYEPLLSTAVVDGGVRTEVMHRSPSTSATSQFAFQIYIPFPANRTNISSSGIQAATPPQGSLRKDELSSTSHAFEAVVPDPRPLRSHLGAERGAVSDVLGPRRQREVSHHDRRPFGVFVEPEENDVTKLHALLVAPRDNQYENSFFNLIPHQVSSKLRGEPTSRWQYDHRRRQGALRSAPRRLRRCTRRHSAYESRRASVEPKQNSFKTVVESIKSLLNVKETRTNESDYERPVGSSGCDTAIQHETIRVAVCDTVEECLNSTRCDGALLEHYGWYEKVVSDQAHLDGTVIVNPFGNSKGVCQHRNFLGRLWYLNEWLHQSYPTVDGKEDAAQV
ncbi:hypothetical protein HPB50_019064 [Hyalomma asiaticum]|uniref:Uncharacterized protein n=1 Tax=Hyalomma asiaticum TaxID=266040 RepID=A0ACB7TMM3_HYAAI|nr:hypothetical protein HPB50_019064 [Hyalomma asiaticum]